MKDVTLTFDPSSFTQGFNSILSHIGNVDRNLSSMNTHAQKGIQKTSVSALSLAKGFVIGQGAVALLSKTLSKMMGAIPELGRAFGMASDVFMRNLLWPLRQELTPLLYKLLNWVRDNRAMFLRWGNVVVNVFRVIKQLVSSLWGIIERLWETLSNDLERIFGKTTRTIEETVNLITFKIAATVEFIMALFEPLAQFLVKVFTKIIGYVKDFVGSFVKGLGDLAPEIQNVFSSISRMGKAIKDMVGDTQILNRLFKTFGTLLAAVVRPILLTISQSIDLVATSIELLVNKLKYFKAWKADNFSEMKRLNREGDRIWGQYEKRSNDAWKRQINQWRKNASDIIDVWKTKPSGEDNSPGTMLKTSPQINQWGQNAKDSIDVWRPKPSGEDNSPGTMLKTSPQIKIDDKGAPQSIKEKTKMIQPQSQLNKTYNRQNISQNSNVSIPITINSNTPVDSSIVEDIGKKIQQIMMDSRVKGGIR